MRARPILVVAGALARADGRWLMHRRPAGKHHAGLWEFPGGKVEPSEMPILSLIRELHEELGITCDPQSLEPCCFAESEGQNGQPGIVILLYTVTRWQGEPQALEGGEVAWMTPEEAMAFEKPPLDIALARQLFGNNVARGKGLAKRSRPPYVPPSNAHP